LSYTLQGGELLQNILRLRVKQGAEWYDGNGLVAGGSRTHWKKVTCFKTHTYVEQSGGLKWEGCDGLVLGRCRTHWKKMTCFKAFTYVEQSGGVGNGIQFMR
jgi:hypothetical protein